MSGVYDWRAEHEKEQLIERKVCAIRDAIRDEVGSRLCAFDHHMRRLCDIHEGKCWCADAARAVLAEITPA